MKLKNLIIGLALFFLPTLGYAATVDVNASYGSRIGRDACGGTTFTAVRNADGTGFGGCAILDDNGQGYAFSDGSAVSIMRTLEKYPVGAALPDNATITAADICIHITQINDGSNQSLILARYSGNQELTSAAAIDYSRLPSQTGTGFPEGIARQDISTLTDDTYNCFALDADGLGWLSTTGSTVFGWRISADADDSTAPNPVAAVQWNTYSHATLKPYLHITYTTPSSSSSSSSTPTFSGSLLITHNYCNEYITNGSGDSVGCNQWDTSIETEFIAAMRVEIGAIVFGAVYMVLRYALLFYLLFISSRWLFRTVTQWKPIHSILRPFRRR